MLQFYAMYHSVQEGRRPVVFLKTAKTGGTSIIELFKRNRPNLLCCSWKDEIPDKSSSLDTDVVVLANAPAITHFKRLHSQFFEEAIKITVVRNPLTRVLSSYNYLNSDTPLIQLLQNPPLPRRDSGTDRETYDHDHVHFTVQQIDAMAGRMGLLEDSSYHFLEFSNLASEVGGLFGMLGFKERTIKWLNRSVPKKKTLSLSEARLARLRFVDDFAFYRKFKHSRLVSGCGSPSCDGVPA